MLLVVWKKMAGWSEVEKERGPVPAAEVVPYAWSHWFLPQEAAKVSRGDDTRDKVMLPWLHLVSMSVLNFEWSRCHRGITISEGGKRAVCSYSSCQYLCAVAEPQVTQGRHWFEVQILRVNVNKSIMIGWCFPGVALVDSYKDLCTGSLW